MESYILEWEGDKEQGYCKVIVCCSEYVEQHVPLIYSRWSVISGRNERDVKGRGSSWIGEHWRWLRLCTWFPPGYT